MKTYELKRVLEMKYILDKGNNFKFVEFRNVVCCLVLNMKMGNGKVGRMEKYDESRRTRRDE